MRTQDLSALRGPVLFAPRHQEGTLLTQAAFVLMSAASSPPQHPLLSSQCSLVYNCPQPPQLKIVTKKNSTETKRKEPGREWTFKELFQTESAELSAGNERLSYYYLNGFQLWGCPPTLAR